MSKFTALNDAQLVDSLRKNYEDRELAAEVANRFESLSASYKIANRDLGKLADELKGKEKLIEEMGSELVRKRDFIAP